MDVRLRIALIGLVGLMVVAVWTFPRWWPLVQPTESITIVFQGLDLELQAAFAQLPDDEKERYFEMQEEEPQMALDMVRARLTTPDPATLTEEQQALMDEMETLTLLRAGDFTNVDELHRGQGTAQVYQLPENRRVLVLDEFRVTNGPALHVIFAQDPNPLTGVEVGVDYIDLGPLQSTTGTQIYEVPDGVDLEEYSSVVIFCVDYGMVFSPAALR